MAHIYSSNSFDEKNLNSKRRTDVCDRGDMKTSAEFFLTCQLSFQQDFKAASPQQRSPSSTNHAT